jgi:hypothetical protein
MQVSLRPLVDADLDAIYEQMKDPESVRMAAFTPDDPADRHAFLVHMSRVRDDPSVVQRVIEADGTIAGTIASFRIDDQTEVTYWIDRALWGRGIASAALQSFLSMTTERPLFARAAADNAASLRVLEGRVPTHRRQSRLRPRSRRGDRGDDPASRLNSSGFGLHRRRATVRRPDASQQSVCPLRGTFPHAVSPR